MDLTTNYLGLSLHSPLVASASPLSEKIENVRGMEQAGAAAVVLHSLFEEQIEAGAPEFRVLRAWLSRCAPGTDFGSVGGLATRGESQRLAPTRWN